MINPQELRIGNYVAVKNHGNDVIGKVFAINKDLISVEGGNNNYDYHLLESIPLTEDILLKCGFNRFNATHGSFEYYSNKGYELYRCQIIMWYDNSSCWFEFNGVKIDSVHALQNVFYIMNDGKELEVKL